MAGFLIYNVVKSFDIYYAKQTKLNAYAALNGCSDSTVTIESSLTENVDQATHYMKVILYLTITILAI